ncbi:MAG TPA: ATP-binding protein [Spirochaetia bacterium]|nr:ATP-binding protein [Spirochaetia bacterium]
MQDAAARKPSPPRRGNEHLLSALRIVLTYAVVAGAWIYFSDTILGSIVRDPQAMVRLSVLKGFAFIVVTGALLHVLIARRIRRIRGVTEALSESEARFRSYVENAPFAILVFDAQGRCTDSNPAARALTGGGAGRLEGTKEDLLRAVDAGGGSGRGAGRPPELEVERPDGRRLWVAERDVRLPGGQTLSFCLDITERIRAEKELVHANARLVQAEKMEAVGRLAGGVAHDFNNILTAIYGYCDVLSRSLDARDPAQDFVSEIHRAAARAASLTQQLLAFSRRQELLPRAVDLNALLRSLRPMLERLIGEDIQVELDLAQDLWTARADPARVEQALVNLAANGRDAMPQGGRLSIRTRNAVLDGTAGGAAGEYVAITVGDTGMGMDAETRSHLFEPFFTTKDVGKGTGLGLSTVYGIVRQSGGSIQFRTEPGHGTEFTIYLPRTRAAAGPAEAAEPARPAARRGELILYVEDDEAVRGMVALALEQQGYEVISAANGAEAVRAAAPVLGRIALVITDVVMPVMNGRELLQRLRGIRPDLKFIFTSGYTRDIVDQHNLPELAEPLIEKPLEPASFLAAVRRALDS